VILLIHNQYRTLGGEERVVDDLSRLIPEYLGESVELLERRSASLSGGKAALALARGGLDPAEVADAVARTGARVVHGHNLLPAFGWRALAAARKAGARTVLSLHQYRLVCAAGTCLDSAGNDCTRCHGRDTRPGVRLNCRGGSRAEAAVYAGSLSAWSARMVAEADVLLVANQTTLNRLNELGAPIEGARVEVIPYPVAAATQYAAPASGEYAICSARLSADKGVDVAIDACARAGRPLVLTGQGPDEAALRAQAARLGSSVTFAGRVPDDELARLRAGAALAVVPSRFAETFGLSAAEAMAAALPVAATSAGALVELLPAEDLSAPGSVESLTASIDGLWGDEARGTANAKRIEEIASPAVVAAKLAAVYDG
jgi:glycosyltransferase involved in cell wall biosynthesis